MLQKNELAELLHDFDETGYHLRDVEEFAANVCECFNTKDIEWFCEWEPGALRLIESSFYYGGNSAYVFDTWEEYEEFIGDNVWNDDPYNPMDGYVFEDAGLSGVWYIGM